MAVVGANRKAHRGADRLFLHREDRLVAGTASAGPDAIGTYYTGNQDSSDGNPCVMPTPQFSLAALICGASRKRFVPA
jgi:hypothetical protein